MKRLSAQAIDNEFVAVLGPNAIGYSTVTNISVNGTSHLLFAKPPTN
jgi:ABC-type cobalamin/Fe3+-siderophores transport system ATPase subunit